MTVLSAVQPAVSNERQQTSLPACRAERYLVTSRSVSAILRWDTTRPRPFFANHPGMMADEPAYPLAALPVVPSRDAEMASGQRPRFSQHVRVAFGYLETLPSIQVVANQRLVVQAVLPHRDGRRVWAKVREAREDVVREEV